MQYQVPQFLDVEDKIIGPLTMKQFIYLAGGLGLAYMAWRFIDYVGLFLAMGCLGLGAALAFYKYNNKPFIYLIESAFNYIKSNRLYVWKRREKKGEEEHMNLTTYVPAGVQTVPAPHMASNKLNDLTWTMDVQTNEVVEVNNIGSDSAVI